MNQYLDEFDMNITIKKKTENKLDLTCHSLF